MVTELCFLGIDMGTTGIRCILSDDKGNIIYSSSKDIRDSFAINEDGRIAEQHIDIWEKALFAALDDILRKLKGYRLAAVTVDSTSGTILPIDKSFKPLHNAIMHNDMRAYRESELINNKMKLATKPSFALPKILWLKNHKPEIFNKTYKFVHAADYLAGLISGEYGITDFSNSVKTGYDLKNMRWPEEIENILGIPLDKLPEVYKTGEIIGELSNSIKVRYGIKENVKIVAGATDSTTGFFSSGAKDIGDWNTTLGTVLGLRGIAEEFIKDKEGLLYTHRHPDGFWLPGGASNTGGEVLRVFFNDKVKEYDNDIMDLPPTNSLVYPLARVGEKLPFFNMDAKGFIEVDACDPAILFKAMLEGLSYVEKLIYDKIENLGYIVNDRVFSMGGGAYSLPWLKIRANVIGKSMARARIVETAFGSCIIAAGGSHYKNITEAIDNMVNIDLTVDPEEKLIEVYRENFERFTQELKKRNYL